MIRTVFAAFISSLSSSSLDFMRLIRLCSKLTAIAKSLCCSEAVISSAYARARPGLACYGWMEGT
jgi:hypothetical protein